MIFKVWAPQDEAKIVPNRLSEPLSSDFGGEKSLERARRATRGGSVGSPGRDFPGKFRREAEIVDSSTLLDLQGSSAPAGRRKRRP